MEYLMKIYYENKQNIDKKLKIIYLHGKML
jgi:hypothetical protein